MTKTHDPRISEIFYYFSDHTDIRTGRTVGRKIGVIQEIIIKKFLSSNQDIRDCLIYEPKLRGKSGATHKVEFVLFSPISIINLEVKNKFRMLSPSIEINLKSIDFDKKLAKIEICTGETKISKNLKVDQSFQFELVFNNKPNNLFLKLITVNQKNCRISILNGLLPIASIESKRVGAQRFSSSDKLGSGIQTIEKAKQTSLVAIDFDLQFNDELLVNSQINDQRKFRSFALLGNGVHWTDHDLSVLETYVDYTFQVKDDAIIRYADYVKKIALEKKLPFFEFFMDYFYGMTVAPEDNFLVTENDFLKLRPLGKNSDKNLVDLVKMQIPQCNILNKC